MGARQIIQIAGCGVTVLLGLMLALVLDADPAMAMMGWVLAVLGLLGLLSSLALFARDRSR